MFTPYFSRNSLVEWFLPAALKYWVGLGIWNSLIFIQFGWVDNNMTGNGKYSSFNYNLKNTNFSIQTSVFETNGFQKLINQPLLFLYFPSILHNTMIVLTQFLSWSSMNRRDNNDDFTLLFSFLHIHLHNFEEQYVSPWPLQKRGLFEGPWFHTSLMLIGNRTFFFFFFFVIILLLQLFSQKSVLLRGARTYSEGSLPVLTPQEIASH